MGLLPSMWDLCSPTRDRTCILRQILNHWATREVPDKSFANYSNPICRYQKFFWVPVFIALFIVIWFFKKIMAILEIHCCIILKIHAVGLCYKISYNQILTGNKSFPWKFNMNLFSTSNMAGPQYMLIYWWPTSIIFYTTVRHHPGRLRLVWKLADILLFYTSIFRAEVISHSKAA